VLMLEGWADIDVDGRVHRLEAGSVSLQLPGRSESFHFAAERSVRHQWCAMNGPTFDALAAPVGSTLPFSQSTSLRLGRLVEMGLDLGPTVDAPMAQVGLKLAETALCEFIAGARSERLAASRLPAPIRKALTFMEAHLHEDLDLERVADAAHVSGAHLIRLFRVRMGDTPIQHLWELRLQRAYHLLTATGLPIQEVARHTGFKTSAHFTRAMKQRYGQSPKHLRNRAWAPDNR